MIVSQTSHESHLARLKSRQDPSNFSPLKETNGYSQGTMDARRRTNDFPPPQLGDRANL